MSQIDSASALRDAKELLRLRREEVARRREAGGASADGTLAVDVELLVSVLDG